MVPERPPAGQSLARLLDFLGKRWRWVLSFAVVVWGLPAALLLVLVFGPPPPSPYAHALADSTKIYDCHGRLLYEVTLPQEGTHTYLRLEEISPTLRQATIATEDASFYRNPGFDVFALGRALVQNLRAGEVVTGGSTITQQLVRNLYLTPEERSSQSIQRKLRETILAFRLTRQLSKDKILELYLNQVYYGNLAYGVEAAAQTYFGKSARHLDLAEASLLAGLPQSPSGHDPLTNLSGAKARQADVLSLMVEAGYASDEEARAARAEPLRFQESGFPIEAPHFVNYVRDLLAERFRVEAIDRGGLRDRRDGGQGRAEGGLRLPGAGERPRPSRRGHRRAGPGRIDQGGRPHAGPAPRRGQRRAHCAQPAGRRRPPLLHYAPALLPTGHRGRGGQQRPSGGARVPACRRRRASHPFHRRR